MTTLVFHCCFCHVIGHSLAVIWHSLACNLSTVSSSRVDPPCENALQAEKKALAEELDLALRHLAEAEAAKRVETARPGTPAKRLAQLQSQLDAARYGSLTTDDCEQAMVTLSAGLMSLC